LPLQSTEDKRDASKISQLNVAAATVTGGGWTQCYSAPYGQFGTSVAAAVSGCTGDLMMLVLRPAISLDT
jgi:hypothetical protein